MEFDLTEIEEKIKEEISSIEGVESVNVKFVYYFDVVTRLKTKKSRKKVYEKEYNLMEKFQEMSFNFKTVIIDEEKGCQD